MVSNVARLTRSLRDAFVEEEAAPTASAWVPTDPAAPSPQQAPAAAAGVSGLAEAAWHTLSGDRAPKSAAAAAARVKSQSDPSFAATSFTTTSLAEKINIVRRELLQSGEAIFTDDRGNRFRIERKPA